MAPKRRVLFLQLPQLDNDVRGPNENIPLAAACLEYAAERAGEGRHYHFLRLPPSLHDAGTPRLLAYIAGIQPAVVACTLYLWNIEWSLRLLRALQSRFPRLRSVVGGPEVAFEHPFLFRARVAHAIVVGEGETVFPPVLRAFRTGAAPDFSTVAIRTPGGYRWGQRPPPCVNLAASLPPPDYPACAPVNGMACLETSRGCPMRCTYCRYPQLRQTMSFLPPADVEARVLALRRCGAREIRFIDPTLNAHPGFPEILRRLARLNRARTLRFFAELNADRLTAHHANLLAAARFTEIEVGLQSRDAAVLRAIRRPTRLDRLESGVRLMTRRGIRVTLDIMYGLPCQRLADIRATLPWALRLRGVNVQCLRTLLLPGTELRSRRRAWKLTAQRLPPYAVTSTATLAPSELRAVEDWIANHPRLRSDVPTGRFVGHRLPDLFTERVRVPESAPRAVSAPAGTRNRRAILFTGRNLFARRAAIAAIIRNGIRAEPDTLFQFVLAPACEEPLDLLDVLIATLRRCSPHRLDRDAAVAQDKLAARRILVLLPPRRRFAPDWTVAAEELLAAHFL